MVGKSNCDNGGANSYSGIRKEYGVLINCFIAVKYLYLALLDLLNIRYSNMSEQKDKKSMGKRPKMGSLEKSMARAARAWHKLQEANSKTEADYEAERIQFADTDGKMGRPAFKVDKTKGHRNQFHAEMLVTREKAQQEWDEALKEYRDLEIKFGADPIPEADIYALQKHTRVGRPGADKVDKLKKYIRRETRRIAYIQSEIDSGATEPEHVRGRKPIPLDKKKKQYQQRVSEAQEQVDELISAMPRSEQIKHEMNDLRIESRQLTVFRDSPEHKQNKSLALDPYNPEHQQFAAARKTEIQDMLVALEHKKRVALSEEKQAAEKHQEGFDRMSAAIEEREAASKANFDRLREQQNQIALQEERKNKILETAHTQMLEERNIKLMEAIRKMGGDPDEILKQMSDQEKTG